MTSGEDQTRATHGGQQVRNRILPLRAPSKTVKASRRYQQIAGSMREIGLVEPPVVARGARQPGM